jgi:hypothetical protein
MKQKTIDKLTGILSGMLEQFEDHRVTGPEKSEIAHFFLGHTGAMLAALDEEKVQVILGGIYKPSQLERICVRIKNHYNPSDLSNRINILYQKLVLSRCLLMSGRWYTQVDPQKAKQAHEDLNLFLTYVFEAEFVRSAINFLLGKEWDIHFFKRNALSKQLFIDELFSFAHTGMNELRLSYVESGDSLHPDIWWPFVEGRKGYAKMLAKHEAGIEARERLVVKVSCAPSGTVLSVSKETQERIVCTHNGFELLEELRNDRLISRRGLANPFAVDAEVERAFEEVAKDPWLNRPS